MIGADGDTTFTVYYLTKAAYRDETPTRNVRHILFTTDTYTDDTKVNEVYAQWEADGFSEAKFLELAAQYNEDPGSQANGGLYENVAVGDMVNSFNNWLFYTAKNVGDHGIVESDYGWHIMYYAGEGEGAAWETQVTTALKNADYAEMLTANKASITYNDKVIADINA
jgi:parvulin-like peptidyl-prolyl isomerase